MRSLLWRKRCMNKASYPVFARLHQILELPDEAFDGPSAMVGRGQTLSIDLRQNEAER
jgi:hypothetical protein